MFWPASFRVECTPLSRKQGNDMQESGVLACCELTAVVQCTLYSPWATLIIVNKHNVRSMSTTLLPILVSRIGGRQPIFGMGMACSDGNRGVLYLQRLGLRAKAAARCSNEPRRQRGVVRVQATIRLPRLR